MTERPSNHIEASGKPGAALIAKLEKLRDSHRLGIHMWENVNEFKFPTKSMHDFNQWTSDAAEQDPTLISISLLPSQDDGITMQPYECMPNRFEPAGYLLDLSEQQEHPPVFVASDVHTLDSGRNSRAKKYPAECAYESLDRLAERYKTEYLPMLSSFGGVGEYNEILARVGHPHVAAIVVPDFRSFRFPVPNYDAMVRLGGCLNALIYAERGTELPVVVYHVNGPYKGEVSYLGEGKETLRHVAGEALDALIDSPRTMQLLRQDCAYQNLVHAAKKHLGINLDKEIDEQRHAFAKLGVNVDGKGRG